eukprot:CAMPEP_0172611346 /NCGR_PEP_ID=MMETSP1068-20121228/31058_1 /TAXON_ID=35684 /ORGANISM="Pseudopedinella elastica, Strain CCMP716" /LENGTH=243 /DNA_ID=CAMNT_0013415303 /DNA_START=214 /DNA_END=945 /DNA_ORIENTATION=+
MAVYMPVIETILLIQFARYHEAPRSRKLQFAATLGIIWVAVLMTGFFAGDDGRSILEWLAVVLWSIESFPQLFQNVEKRQTQGQSKVSVVIACAGKFTDSLSVMSLKMPTQTMVLIYMSTTLAWINAVEIVVLEECHCSMRGILTCAVLLLLGIILVLATFWRIGVLALLMPSGICALLGFHWAIIKHRRRTSGKSTPGKIFDDGADSNHAKDLSSSVAQDSQPQFSSLCEYGPSVHLIGNEK